MNNLEKLNRVRKLKVLLDELNPDLDALFDEVSNIFSKSNTDDGIEYFTLLNEIESGIFLIKNSKDKIKEWESNAQERSE